MSITSESLTVESVTKELTELEETYRRRRKKLRALLGVLRAEAGLPVETESAAGKKRGRKANGEP